MCGWKGEAGDGKNLTFDNDLAAVATILSASRRQSPLQGPFNPTTQSEMFRRAWIPTTIAESTAYEHQNMSCNPTIVVVSPNAYSDPIAVSRISTSLSHKYVFKS